MEPLATRAVGPLRSALYLLGLFAAVALTLSAVGIYGVVSYAASRRTHEIGVRLAMGAKERDVIRLVVRHGMTLVLIGLALGVAGSFAATRVLASLLYGIQPTDAATFAAVSLLLAAVAFLASYLPARRAAKLDPMAALRAY